MKLNISKSDTVGVLMVKVALLLAGTFSLTLVCGQFTSRVQAQSLDGISNTLPDVGEQGAPIKFDNARPVRQQSFPLDTDGGSQQFFRQGSEQLYLLPEQEAEPILKIDETIEADDIDYEDLQSEPPQE